MFTAELRTNIKLSQTRLSRPASPKMQNPNPKKNKFKLFYLPSYSPELNPDESLNRDVKAHLSDTKVPKTADELTRTVQTHLEKKDKASVKRLFHKPEVRYAAGNEQ